MWILQGLIGRNTGNEDTIARILMRYKTQPHILGEAASHLGFSLKCSLSTTQFSTVFHCPGLESRSVWNLYSVKRVVKEHYRLVAEEYNTMMRNLVKETSIVSTTNTIELIKVVEKGYWVRHNVQFLDRTKQMLTTLAIPMNGLSDAYFLILPGNTTIRSQFGRTNSLLTLHLPILAQHAKAHLVVGENTYHYQVGQPVVFDGTFVHRLICQGDRRNHVVILVMNIWHPEVSFRSRNLITSVFLARTAPPGLFAQDDNCKVHKPLRIRPVWIHPPPALQEGAFGESDSFGTLSLLVLGDESVGKSAFHRGLAHYSSIAYPPEDFTNDCVLKRVVYPDSVLQDGLESVEDINLRVLLRDNANLRTRLCPDIQAATFYRGVHGIFLCFDVTQRKSFDHILNFWMEEIDTSRNSSVVIILVGLKTDLQEHRVVSAAEANQVARMLGLLYYECSSSLEKGLGLVFDAMVHSILCNPIFRTELWQDYHLNKQAAETQAGWFCMDDSSDRCCIC